MNETSASGGECGKAGRNLTDSTNLQPLAAVLEQLRPALLSVPLLTLLTGVVFPLALAALAWPLFPHQADGSLIVRDGVVSAPS